MRAQLVSMPAANTTAPARRSAGRRKHSSATVNMTVACALGSEPRAPCSMYAGLRPTMNGRGRFSSAAMAWASIEASAAQPNTASM